MNSWGTILLGYGVAIGGVGFYAFSLIRRGSLLGSKMGLGGQHRLPGGGSPTSLEGDDAGT